MSTLTHFAVFSWSHALGPCCRGTMPQRNPALGQGCSWSTISVPGSCTALGSAGPCRLPLLRFRLTLLPTVLDILCFHIFAWGSLRWIPGRWLLGQRVSRYPVFLVIVKFSFIEIRLIFTPIMWEFLVALSNKRILFVSPIEWVRNSILILISNYKRGLASFHVVKNTSVLVMFLIQFSLR